MPTEQIPNKAPDVAPKRPRAESSQQETSSFKEQQRAHFNDLFQHAYNRIQEHIKDRPPTSHKITEEGNRQTIQYGDPLAGLSFEDLGIPNRNELFETHEETPEQYDAISTAFLEALITTINEGLRKDEEDAARIFAQLMGDQFANEDLQRFELLERLTPAHALKFAVACSEWSFEQAFSASALHAFVKKTEEHAGRGGFKLKHDESLQKDPTTTHVHEAFQEYINNASTVDQVAFMNYAPTMRLNFAFMYEPEYVTDKDVFFPGGKGMFAEEALWTFLQQEDPEGTHPFVRAAHARALSQIKMDTRHEVTYEDFSRIREVPLEQFMPISRDFQAKYDRSETIQRVLPENASEEASVQQGQTLDGAMRQWLPAHITHDANAFRMLREFYRPWMMESLSEQINVDIRKLTFREQMQLFTFFAGADANHAMEGFRAVSDHGLPAARAFLACEKDPRAADDILLIAEHADAKDAETVFTAFTRIADLLRVSSKELYEEVFAKTEGERPSREAVDDEFVSRARAILKEYAQTIRQDDAEKAKDITKQLEQLEADTILFASVFKTAFKGKPNVRFEDLRGMELLARTRKELDEETQKEMLAMASTNWKQDPLLRDVPVQLLKQKLQGDDADSLFYSLRKNDRLLAFMRFDERPDGDLYAGALNVDPTLRGSAVGEAFLNASLDRAAKERRVHAIFPPQVDAGMMYIDRFEWIGTGIETIQGADGQRIDCCEIIRRTDWHERLNARQPNITNDYLISLIENPHAPFRVERFHFPQDQKRFTDTIKQATQEGLVVSRYFPETPDGRSRIAVFEPKPHT